MVLSSVFYGLYFILSLLFPLISIKKVNTQLLLISLIFTVQFNVTTFLKAGMTIGYFEIALFIIFVILLLKVPFKSLTITAADRVFIIFLAFCLISIFIANIRIFVQDLIPTNEYGISPIARSLMSLNKVIVFLPIIIIVRNQIFNSGRYKNNDGQKNFFLILALSGILPSIAVLLESLNIGFALIHNNPSFAETFHIEVYNGVRAVGLSNEASFFAYNLFFSYMGAMEIFYRYPDAHRKKMLFIIIFYWICLLLTISRTGMLLFVCYTIYKYFKNNPIRVKTILKVAAIITVCIVILSNITIQNFNLKDRLVSSFVVDADASTIERYGVTQALYDLTLDKGIFLGFGIYNYQYYIKKYLPGYMDVISYDKGEAPPSFNFILQLVGELGIVLFLAMFAGMFYVLRTADIFVKEWFIFLFLFALSFQVLNFTIPFIILLFPPPQNENSLYNQ